MRQTFTEAEAEMIQRCISNDPYFRITEGSLGLAIHIIRKLAMNQDAEPEPFERAIVELAECAKASMASAQAERRRYALLQARRGFSRFRVVHHRKASGALDFFLDRLRGSKKKMSTAEEIV